MSGSVNWIIIIYILIGIFWYVLFYSFFQVHLYQYYRLDKIWTLKSKDKKKYKESFQYDLKRNKLRMSILSLLMSVVWPLTLLYMFSPLNKRDE